MNPNSNPSPISDCIKKQVLVTIMASVGAQSAYANDIVAVQRVTYNKIHNFSCTAAHLSL